MNMKMPGKIFELLNRIHKELMLSRAPGQAGPNAQAVMRCALECYLAELRRIRASKEPAPRASGPGASSS